MPINTRECAKIGNGTLLRAVAVYQGTVSDQQISYGETSEEVRELATTCIGLDSPENL